MRRTSSVTVTVTECSGGRGMAPDGIYRVEIGREFKY